MLVQTRLNEYVFRHEQDQVYFKALPEDLGDSSIRIGGLSENWHVTTCVESELHQLVNVSFHTIKYCLITEKGCCQFQAFGLWLRGNQEDYNSIRQAVIHELEVNNHHYLPYDPELDFYVDLLKKILVNGDIW
jgi:hypothetical protein